MVIPIICVNLIHFVIVLKFSCLTSVQNDFTEKQFELFDDAVITKSALFKTNGNFYKL